MRALVGIAAAALALIPASAHAQGPAEPYDGTIPFDCVLQQAGTEAEFPDPDADPFCVEYDKRHQNVSEGGVVEFLSLEPARVAAASPKCFYFQRDHWVGSIVQDDGRTETYSWDGSYYFDKAKGAGGAYVENFTFNNQSGDPTAMPGFPEEWKPYFGYGRGGFHATGSVDADPACVAKAEENSPYRKEPEPSPAPRGCPEAEGERGPFDRGLRLGAHAGARRSTTNGEPMRRKLGFFRYCIIGGGKYMVGFGRERARVPADQQPGLRRERGQAADARAPGPPAPARGEGALPDLEDGRLGRAKARPRAARADPRAQGRAASRAPPGDCGRKRLFAYYKASR